MVFLCKKSKEEIVRLLEKPRFEDNLDYEFEEEDGAYAFGITKIPFQIGKKKPVVYKLWFEEGNEGTYLCIEAKKKTTVFVSSMHEPEIYRFFIEVCDCEPVEKIK